MKFLTFILVSFSIIIETASEEKEMDKDSVQKSSNIASFLDIIQRILNDQEFLSLSDHRQLRILLIIYEIFEEHYKT